MDRQVIQRLCNVTSQIAVGCAKSFNVCETHTPVRLLFNKKPGSDDWYEVMPLCIPNHNRRLDCDPNVYHAASEYTADTTPSWTRITMSLPEKTFSRYLLLSYYRVVVIKEFCFNLYVKERFFIIRIP